MSETQGICAGQGVCGGGRPVFTTARRTAWAGRRRRGCRSRGRETSLDALAVMAEVLLVTSEERAGSAVTDRGYIGVSVVGSHPVHHRAGQS